MPKSVLHSKRTEALQLVGFAAGVISLVSIVLLIIQPGLWSYSLLLGGIVWLVPNFYFVVKVFALKGTKTTPQRLLINFYRAEVIKLALCAILFIIILQQLSVIIIPMLIGFAIAQIAFWSAPFILFRAKG